MLNAEKETFPNETRALGSNSRWYVASFAMAVITKQRSLDCDDFLKLSPLELSPESCLKPKRLWKQTKEKQQIKTGKF